MNKLTQKAIDTIFEIMKYREKADKLNDYGERLNIVGDFFCFHSFLSINIDLLVNFLDEYFFELLGAFNPQSEGGGLASYTLYDAATPYIGDKPYNLKEKSEFEQYIRDYKHNNEVFSYKPCETCNDVNEECAELPSLRHCEKATRHRQQ